MGAYIVRGEPYYGIRSDPSGAPGVMIGATTNVGEVVFLPDEGENCAPPLGWDHAVQMTNPLTGKPHYVPGDEVTLEEIEALRESHHAAMEAKAKGKKKIPGGHTAGQKHPEPTLQPIPKPKGRAADGPAT